MHPRRGKAVSIRPDREGKSMAKELVTNEWGIILQQGPDLLELKWLASTANMTDGGFMATLCLFAIEPPADRPWGARGAYVRGPGALTIEFEQLTRPSP